MFEYIILGAVQGIAEWLPVSSEGMIALIKISFFPSSAGFFDVVKEALFLHLGTALAAIVYFRKDIFSLTHDLIRYKEASIESKRILFFLIVATVISGGLGLALLSLVPDTSLNESTGRVFTAIVGIFLLITAFLQLYNTRHSEEKKEKEITSKDSVVLGVAQGFAVLPGLSRSGLTVASLLLLGYGKKESLRLSFLLSIPIVLAGNVVLNISDTHTLTAYSIAGLISSFVFGIITIDLLLRLAQKINFGYFVLFFAILTMFAAFL